MLIFKKHCTTLSVGWVSSIEREPHLAHENAWADPQVKIKPQVQISDVKLNLRFDLGGQPTHFHGVNGARVLYYLSVHFLTNKIIF